MPVVILIARIVVLLFALVGSAGAAVVGLLIREDVTSRQEDIDRGQLPPSEEVPSENQAVPFLFAAAVLGLVGGALAMAGRTASGGVWLLVAAVGPAVLSPVSMCGTFGLLLGGVLSLAAGVAEYAGRPKPGAA